MLRSQPPQGRQQQQQQQQPLGGASGRYVPPARRNQVRQPAAGKRPVEDLAAEERKERLRVQRQLSSEKLNRKMSSPGSSPLQVRALAATLMR